eukprot:GHVR01113442.1.p1 GENE.GHVR01113442.1~~GHVR01113442.1.p1  ORF type:complete len:220 (-),score=32.32 GHVR01113442.1:76-735(-)
MSREQTFIETDELLKELPPGCKTSTDMDEVEFINPVLMRALTLGIIPAIGEVKMLEQKINNREDISRLIHINKGVNDQYITDKDIEKFWNECMNVLDNVNISIQYKYPRNSNGMQKTIKAPLLCNDVNKDELTKRKYILDDLSDSNPWNFSVFPASYFKKIFLKTKNINQVWMSVGTKILQKYPFFSNDFLCYSPSVNYSADGVSPLGREFKVQVNFDP